MKYQKIVETSDRILYLTGEQAISYRWAQEATAKSDIYLSIYIYTNR